MDWIFAAIAVVLFGIVLIQREVLKQAADLADNQNKSSQDLMRLISYLDREIEILKERSRKLDRITKGD